MVLTIKISLVSLRRYRGFPFRQVFDGFHRKIHVKVAAIKMVFVRANDVQQVQTGTSLHHRKSLKETNKEHPKAISRPLTKDRLKVGSS